MTGQFLSSHDEEGFKQNLINQKWDQQAADAAALVAAATLQITAKGSPLFITVKKSDRLERIIIHIRQTAMILTGKQRQVKIVFTAITTRC